MDESNSQDGPVKRRSSRMGMSRTPMHLVFHASIGVILGLGLASVIDLPNAELALVGVFISIAAWLVEQGFTLPGPLTKPGVRIRFILRLVALIGFAVSVSALLELTA